jgi:hypothetical protein
MKDQTLVKLLQAKRTAVRLAEPYQSETSNKHVIIPMHAWEALIEATQAVLLEELQS